MERFIVFFRQLLTRFLKQSKGAVVIEAAFIFIAFAAIVAIAVDLGTAFIKQSRLERATYTAASVLRERVALYKKGMDSSNRNPPITADQVEQLRKIVSQLIPDNELVIIVDELQFESVTGTSERPKEPIVLSGWPKTLTSAGATKSSCGQLPPLNQYKDLSPYSARKRWLPLYRVTICLPGEKSWFKNIVNSNSGEQGFEIKQLTAYAIVIPR